MSKCPNCGVQVEEKSDFCSRCETSLKPQPDPYIETKKLKPLARVLAALCTGAGLTMTIMGLIIFFMAISSYTHLRAVNPANGFQLPPSIRDILSSKVSEMGHSITLTGMGLFLTTYGLLYQFSHAARASWKKPDMQARVRNGLLLGGFLLAGSFADNLVKRLYDIYFSRFDLSSFYAVLAGIIMVAIGLVLLLKPRHRRNLTNQKVVR